MKTTVPVLVLALVGLTACEPGKEDSGLVDSGWFDADGDGYASPEDCDDEDPDVNPDGVEIYDGIDQDCSGVADDNLPAWGYVDSEEHVGPERWHEYWPDCGSDSQSPLDLDVPITEGSHPTMSFHYTETSTSIKNNGHSIQWTIDGGSTVEVDGVQWALEQLHFHAGSEHLIQGERLPLEAHLVHRDDRGSSDTSDDALLVLSVMFEVSDEGHPYLDDLGWQRMPEEEQSVHTDAAAFSPLLLFVEEGFDQPQTLRYSGSLTTPPCSEIVTWALVNTSDSETGALGLPISSDQLAAFTDLHVDNYRDPQARNGRELVVD